MPRFKCFIFLKRWIMDNEKWYMSTIKNGQILLYCHFNKIIKEPGTSFQLQHLAKNMLEMFIIQHTSIWPNFILIGFKTNKHKCNLQLMMTSQILKSAGFTETQKSRYLENETFFFFQIKNSLITPQALLYEKE